jgi:biopolymer transport protein ExbD
MTEDTLSPAQRARIRRLAVPVEPEAGDAGGELNIVPYLDILMNVMMFVLASVSVAFASTITTDAAAHGRIEPHPGALHLTALVTGQGVALKTASGSIAPGCGDVGPGITVPNAGGAYDLAALTACARRVKGMAPAETQATLTASPDVPYDVVVGVMDALRADESGQLFPDVTLGAVR